MNGDVPTESLGGGGWGADRFALGRFYRERNEATGIMSFRDQNRDPTLELVSRGSKIVGFGMGPTRFREEKFAYQCRVPPKMFMGKNHRYK